MYHIANLMLAGATTRFRPPAESSLAKMNVASNVAGQPQGSLANRDQAAQQLRRGSPTLPRPAGSEVPCLLPGGGAFYSPPTAITQVFTSLFGFPPVITSKAVSLM